MYESFVLGEEYLGAPDADCEQGSKICLKGLLELRGKGGKGVIEKVGFMGDKLTKVKNLLLSFNDGLIENGLAKGFP